MKAAALRRTRKLGGPFVERTKRLREAFEKNKCDTGAAVLTRGMRQKGRPLVSRVSCLVRQTLPEAAGFQTADNLLAQLIAQARQNGNPLGNRLEVELLRFPSLYQEIPPVLCLERLVGKRIIRRLKVFRFMR